MSIHEKAPLLARDKTSSSRLLGVKPESKFRLVIHGGAGTMDKSQSTPELRAKYKAALSRALIAGYVVLEAGGEAMGWRVYVSHSRSQDVNHGLVTALPGVQGYEVELTRHAPAYFTMHRLQNPTSSVNNTTSYARDTPSRLRPCLQRRCPAKDTRIRKQLRYRRSRTMCTARKWIPLASTRRSSS